ncbi:MAG: neutral/alkaline non-lysosomal ceramidase N-terminal domain-containing protein [Candidatus Sumerlaeaceae bacterium]
MALRAGTAKSIITPELGTPMGGNARLDNYARGVLQDLYARALFLNDGITRICIVSLDLLGMWQADADRLRAAVAAELGIPVGNVTMCSTHTHSGPDTFQSLCWNDDKLERDGELLKPFWEMLPGRILEAARTAQANARECTMQWGTAENREIANNRRLLMKTGETVMNWELPPVEEVEGPLGPIDPRVSAVVFRADDGEMLGGFVHYPCHPAILAGANLQMSGDFAGFAMAQLEQGFGCQAMLFLHGAAGNVNHIDYQHPERGRDAQEVHRCAASLAASVLEIVERINHRDTETQRQTQRSCLLSVTNHELSLPIREIPEDQIAAAKELLAAYDGHDLSMPDGVPPELNARRTLKLVEANTTGRYPGKFGTMREGKIVLPLQVIRIGDVMLGTVPAEIFVEFGLSFAERIERQQRSATQLALLVGLANGLSNYIPTPQAFEQGGYEPGLGPSYLPKNAGNEIVDTLIEMATTDAV